MRPDMTSKTHGKPEELLHGKTPRPRAVDGAKDPVSNRRKDQLQSPTSHAPLSRLSGGTYPPHSLRFLLRQLNDMLSTSATTSEIPILLFFVITTRKQLHQGLRVLVDQLSELRVVRCDLLNDRLKIRWILLHEL